MSTITKKHEPKFLHEDYVPIRTIPIEGVSRKKRKESFSVFWLGNNFKNHILPLMTDKKTSSEVLRQDELQCGTTFWAHKADPSKGEYISSVGHSKNRKNDSQIIKDLNISMIDADTLGERILQVLKDQMDGKKGIISNTNATVIGYTTVSLGKKDTTYTVVAGFLGPEYDNRWGIDAQINIPWVSELQILSKNK